MLFGCSKVACDLCSRAPWLRTKPSSFTHRRSALNAIWVIWVCIATTYFAFSIDNVYTFFMHQQDKKQEAVARPRTLMKGNSSNVLQRKIDALQRKFWEGAYSKYTHSNGRSFPVILCSAWVMCIGLNAVLVFILAYTGFQLQESVSQDGQRVAKDFLEFLEVAVATSRSALSTAAVGLQACSLDSQVQDFLDWLIGTFLPEAILLMGPVSQGAGFGLAVGAFGGWMLTLSGVFTTWKTYNELYDHVCHTRLEPQATYPRQVC